MNAKDFIISTLKEFLVKFKDARVRYEHDSSTQTHTVEVLPQSVFDSPDFLDWECRLYDQFSFEYPGEVIGFISEDALVGINKVDFDGNGCLYGSFTTNPSFVFYTPAVRVEMSTTTHRSTSLSVSEIHMMDIFEEIFVSHEEYPNNYQLAA